VDEFKEWLAYFSIKEKQVEKTDFYIARLSYIVASMFGKGKIEFKDFLLNSQTEDEKRECMKTKFSSWVGKINKRMKEENEKKDVKDKRRT
jgi:hypothetical protein